MELQIGHDVTGLVKGDRVLAKEPLVPGLQSDEDTREDGQGNVVQHSVDITVVSVRVDSEKDRDLTHDQHDISKYLQKQNWVTFGGIKNIPYGSA